MLDRFGICCLTPKRDAQSLRIQYCDHIYEGIFVTVTNKNGIHAALKRNTGDTLASTS